jgi:uncharacterized membrane protein
MSKGRNEATACAVCGRSFPRRQLVLGAIVRPAVAEVIRRDHPEWSAEHFICREDLTRYRGLYVHSLLESERGELTDLEQEVVHSLREHELLAANVEAQFEQRWSFLICFGAFFALWIAANSLVLLWKPVDPYPFILLNLLLSCLAAIQAPVIMMSQNRQEAKDRLRSQHDYKVNLKAELEIRHLHEKLDHLLSHQWERLVAIQEVQLELLSELGRRR